MSNAQILAAVAFLSGKNRIINGDCRVQQRANVANSSVSTYGPVDRFQTLNSGSGGTISMNASSMTIAGISPSALAVFCGTTIPTTFTGAAFYGGIYQAIEGFNCYDMLGQPAVYSFWFNATVPGLYSVAIGDYTNANSYCTSFNYTTANTPQKIIIRIPTLPTSLAVPNNSNGGLYAVIGALATGTRMCPTASLGAWQTGVGYLAAQGCVNWATVAGNTIAATRMQLETGTNPTSFEERPIQAEINYCYRYFFTSTYSFFGWPGNPSDTYRNWTGSFPVPMRAAPTLTATSSNGTTTLAAVSTTQWSANLSTGNTTTSYSINSLTASSEL